MVIDFHTHTFLSDGYLNPSAAIYYAWKLGYRAIGLTDHVDAGNWKPVLEQILRVCEDANRRWDITAIPGVEITHAPAESIPEIAEKARHFGAQIIVVHGETPVELVPPGTNHFAMESDIDILAHPGFISEDDVQLAASRGIYLEISARKGHSLTNGYVAQQALKFGAQMVIDSDAHTISDYLSDEMVRKVGLGAGLTEEQFADVLKNAEHLLEKVKSAR
ncbi:MAG: histidinol phosphate phosphatase domain-containing protein [Calditrichaeota bacterium]|nr:histidinol phosphate phosphatase domain-containing protein [Calditrichota bacterium]